MTRMILLSLDRLELRSGGIRRRFQRNIPFQPRNHRFL
uniref:Uncharacterized protein n=1 Tax=Nelumbo nucifera TaxID=4432 RepID=A0A822XWL8_NELNU|nr:TPA_asm: hypothetical protein HUJ06_024628 [Nelumbo nucifera]